MLSRVLQEWVLKRLYRLVLKPVLGKVLDSDLDLAQLDVQFLNGTIELRDLVLNAKYVSEQTKDLGLEIVSGTVSYIRAEIPYYALSTSQIVVSVEGLRVTVRPTKERPPLDDDDDGHLGDHEAGDEQEGRDGDLWGDSTSEDEGEDDGGVGSGEGGRPKLARKKSVIRSSIEMIAGGLEDFLQKLRVDCGDVEVELAQPIAAVDSEQPGRPRSLCLALDHLCYETKTDDDRVEGSPFRQVSFAGLEVFLRAGKGEGEGEGDRECSSSDDEFHDALGTPTSACSEEDSPGAGAHAHETGCPKKTDLEEAVLTGEGSDGLCGWLVLRDGGATGEAEGQGGGGHAEVDVKLCRPVLRVDADAARDLAVVPGWFAGARGAEEDRGGRSASDGHGDHGTQTHPDQSLVIDSVLFPDCKTIAADILPQFFSKGGNASAVEGEETPAEAADLASSVEEFFDASSRMAVSLGDAKAAIARARERGGGSGGRGESQGDAAGGPGAVLRVSVAVRADSMALDAPLEAAEARGAAAGVRLRLVGVAATHKLYAGGEGETGASCSGFELSCRGVAGQAEAAEWAAYLDRSLVAGLPRGRERLGSVWAGFGAGCHGQVVLASTYGLREDGIGTRLELGASCGGVTRVSLQPFWIAVDDKVAGQLLQLASEQSSRYAADFAPAEVEAPEATSMVSPSSSSSTCLLVDISHARVVARARGIGGLALDVVAGGNEENLAFLSFCREGGKNQNQLVADICAREVAVSALSSGGKPGGAIEHQVLAKVSGVPSFKLHVRVGAMSTPAKQEEATAFEPFENLSRKFDGAETEEVRRCLDDYGLQERAVSTASVFVHLSGARAWARASPEDCRTAAAVAAAVAASAPAETTTASTPPKTTTSLRLDEACALVEASVVTVETPSPGGGGRVYGARLKDARVFARGGQGHGAWARISASGAAAYSRSASGEEDEVVAIVAASLGNHDDGAGHNDKALSCVAATGPGGRLLCACECGRVVVSAPPFLFEGGEVDALAEAAAALGMADEEAQAPPSLRLSLATRQAEVRLEVPAVHDRLHSASLSRCKAATEAVMARVDLERGAADLSARGVAIRMEFRDKAQGMAVLEEERISVSSRRTAVGGAGGRALSIATESLKVRATEDSVAGCFQLAELLLERVGSRLQGQCSDGDCDGGSDASGRGVADVAAHRRAKRDRARLERKLSLGGDTPWVVVDDSVGRRGSEDSASGFTDVEIDGYSCVYGDSATIIEDYIPVPQAFEDESDGAGAAEDFGMTAAGPSGSEGDWPEPASALQLRTKRVALMLEAGAGEESYVVRVGLRDAMVRMEDFAEGEERLWRSKAAVRGVEVAEEWLGKTTRALFVWETVQRPIEDGSFALSAEVSASRAEGGGGDPAEDEVVVHAALLPLRVRLNPNLVQLLADFSQDISRKLAELGDGEEDYYEILADTVATEALAYIKRCHVAGTSVRLDYNPQRPHFPSKAKARSVLVDLLNLVPLHGVELSMKTVLLQVRTARACGYMVTWCRQADLFFITLPPPHSTISLSLFLSCACRTSWERESAARACWASGWSTSPSIRPASSSWGSSPSRACTRWAPAPRSSSRSQSRSSGRRAA